MNSKDKEYNIDIDEYEVDDNEELLELGVEFEGEDFFTFPSDSIDSDDADNEPPGDAVPPEGDESTRDSSEHAKQCPEPQKPAVIKKAKRPQENNNSDSTAHSSMPTPQAYYDGLRQETAFNNMIAGNIKSHERRTDAELRVLEAQQQTAFRESLRGRKPSPLPQALEIQAEFPLATLPPSMALVIREVADSLQVPIEAVGSSLLGALSIAARGNYQIQVKVGYNEALTLFMMVGLPSGGRKSGIVSLLRRVFNAVEQERQIAFDRDATESMLTKEVLKSIKRTVKSDELATLMPVGALSYDDIAAMVVGKLKPIQENLEKVDWRPRLLVDSPTLKELGVAMQMQGEAIGIFEAEGGIWKNRVQANVDDIVLKGATMEPFSDETSTAKSVVMSKPCLSITSLVQMEVAETLYSRARLKDHGVLPRILVTFARWQGGPKRANSPAVHQETMALYEGKIRSLLDISRPEGQKGERTWHTLHLSPGAEAVRIAFEQEVNWAIHQGRFVNFESFGEKLVGHAVRLAAATHLWKHDVPHEQLIRGEAMRAGVELARFYAQHAMAAFDLQRLQALKFANRILTWLQREPKPFFSRRDAQRGLGRCHADEVQAGLDELERCGILGQYITPKHALKCAVNPNFTNPTF